MAIRYISKNKENKWIITNSEDGDAVFTGNNKKETVDFANKMANTNGVLIKKGSKFVPAEGWYAEMEHIAKEQKKAKKAKDVLAKAEKKAAAKEKALKADALKLKKAKLEAENNTAAKKKAALDKQRAAKKAAEVKAKEAAKAKRDAKRAADKKRKDAKQKVLANKKAIAKAKADAKRKQEQIAIAKLSVEKKHKAITKKQDKKRKEVVKKKTIAAKKEIKVAKKEPVKVAKVVKAKKEAKPKKDKKALLNTHIVKATSNRAPVLKVNKITKKFGQFVALNEVSFTVAKGERIGLIGGNGAGKTTVSEIIAGINKPTSGTLEFGFDFKDSPKEGIGMQFQQSTYPSGLTVKDIVSFARNLRKLNMTNDELKDLLKVFQMEDFYGRKVRSLSGGQRQKLNILLSIIHNPSLVILDELSTGLDISAREEIIEFTDKLLTENNMSAILISHHMAEIKALATKVVVLDNGEVRDVKLVKDIIKEFGSLDAYAKKYIVESNQRTIDMERAKNEKKVNDKLAAKLAADKARVDKEEAKIARTEKVRLAKKAKADAKPTKRELEVIRIAKAKKAKEVKEIANRKKDREKVIRNKENEAKRKQLNKEREIKRNKAAQEKAEWLSKKSELLAIAKADKLKQKEAYKLEDAKKETKPAKKTTNKPVKSNRPASEDRAQRKLDRKERNAIQEQAEKDYRAAEKARWAEVKANRKNKTPKVKPVKEVKPKAVKTPKVKPIKEVKPKAVKTPKVKPVKEVKPKATKQTKEQKAKAKAEALSKTRQIRIKRKAQDLARKQAYTSKVQKVQAKNAAKAKARNAKLKAKQDKERG